MRVVRAICTLIILRLSLIHIFGKSILKYYVIVLIIFAVISILFYGWKYADTQKRVRWYYKDLQSLDEINDGSDKKDVYKRQECVFL